MILSGKNEENKSMKKAKRCLIAVVSGVLVATAVLSGCGQSKKEVSINDDHLTVYLWENRLMKNIAPYIHEQFPDQDIEFIIGNNDTDLYSYFKEHDELPDIITVRRFSGSPVFEQVANSVKKAFNPCFNPSEFIIQSVVSPLIF